MIRAFGSHPSRRHPLDQLAGVSSDRLDRPVPGSRSRAEVRYHRQSDEDPNNEGHSRSEHRSPNGRHAYSVEMGTMLMAADTSPMAVQLMHGPRRQQQHQHQHQAAAAA